MSVQTRPLSQRCRSFQQRSGDRPAGTTEPAHATCRTACIAPGPATPENRGSQPGPCAHTQPKTPSTGDTTDTPPAARPPNGQQPRTHRQKQDTAIRWPRVNTHPSGPLPAERQLDEPGGVPRVQGPRILTQPRPHQQTPQPKPPARYQPVKPPTTGSGAGASDRTFTYDTPCYVSCSSAGFSRARTQASRKVFDRDVVFLDDQCSLFAVHGLLLGGVDAGDE